MSVTCDRSMVITGTPVSSNNKTDRHDETEILLIGVLKTITPLYLKYCEFIIQIPTIILHSLVKTNQLEQEQRKAWHIPCPKNLTQ